MAKGYLSLSGRRSIRLKGYDYAGPGAYFVTVCTHERWPVFGSIVGGEMALGQFGRVVRDCWAQVPEHFPRAELAAFVVMPNHMHGIVIISDEIGDAPVLAPHANPEAFARPARGSLATILRSFKSVTTKLVNNMRCTAGAPLWQKGYYEHIIRTDDELFRIAEYIDANPLNWDADRENPGCSRPADQLPFEV